MTADITLSGGLPQTLSMTQPLSWFEIPAVDFDRARSFYEQLFGVTMKVGAAGPNTMGVFPYDEEKASGGCVMAGPKLTPTDDGVIIYLNAGEALDPVLQRVPTLGGQVVFPKTEVPGHGYFAHMKDSEGNRVGLFAVK
jgi:predicted enzyme related to lactoylglutathione lyase